MILYHVTWERNLKSILRNGLAASHRPNKWLPGARKRSKGKLFFCNEGRREYWQALFEDGWAGDWQTGLVWLQVNVNGIDITPDKGDNTDDYTGDYWTTATIPPERIKVLQYVQ